MINRKRFYICLAALLAWLAFIFCRSLQPAATSDVESGRALDLLTRLFPFPLSMHFVRKAAHFTEFAILGVLAGLLFSTRSARGWLLPAAMTGLIAALCDETIQLFVEGRTGKLQDVWLDAAGVSAGLLFLLAVYCVQKKRRQPFS